MSIVSTVKNFVKGSLTREAFDSKEEINKIIPQLEEQRAIAAVATTEGWSIVADLLKRNVEESANSIVGWSNDPDKNKVLIIAEGAKREEDLKLLKLIGDAPKIVKSLEAKIETLNRILQAGPDEDAPRLGPERK